MSFCQRLFFWLFCLCKWQTFEAMCWNALGLNWEPLFLPNPHWDRSGKCLVNAQSWHVMIDKTWTPEPRQTPKVAQGYIIKPGSAV